MNKPTDGITTAAATPKLRSRKGGAAIPLDDTDKRLMNLLQSNFPLDPRAVRRSSPRRRSSTVDEVKARTQRLLDERIIREITPIFDTRALGYSSMLVAAKVDSENPHRAGEDHQLPSRRLPQLPARPTSSTSGSRSRPRPTRCSASRARSRSFRS